MNVTASFIDGFSFANSEKRSEPNILSSYVGLKQSFQPSFKRENPYETYGQLVKANGCSIRSGKTWVREIDSKMNVGAGEESTSS